MDRRQQKSRAAILLAFEHLLARRSYREITVQQIIDEANVGRTTFYAHFETKDALLQELCTNLFDHVFSDRPDPESSHDFSLTSGDYRTVIAHILYHLKENGPSLSRLLVGESSELFLAPFQRYLDENILRDLTARAAGDHTAVPRDFLQNHISGSFVHMVQWWIRGGMQIPPDTLAGYFLAVTEPIL